MFVPSLQHLILTKCVVSLYKEPEFRFVERTHQKALFCIPGHLWEHMVRKKMCTPTISFILQNEAVALMRCISYEADAWRCKLHCIFCTCHFYDFVWNVDGTINEMKTASLIIESDIPSFELRFVLACQYWCNVSVLLLWDTFPPSERARIFQRFCNERLLRSFYERNVGRWIKWYQRYIASPPDKDMLIKPFRSFWANSLTIHGFLRHGVPQPELDKFFTYFMKYPPDIPTIRFIMTQMDEIKREKMLLLCPMQILILFLFRPLQDSFMSAARKVWDLLAGNHFVCLLHFIICQRIMTGWKDYHYVDLLRRFWYEAPERLREYTKGTDIYKVLNEIISFGCPEIIPQHYHLHEESLYENSITCSRVQFD
ncbi:uncharacterized protein NPIL_61071 [Nephila pilipes]|uniref:Uncharacterized protein n=1 Tax=Nephila pilipes TaxID=299642 RepID=A0A8X6TMD0_NEPPI|nr:uncharacterized protein NPIL_61071 [Nephila pilipes]